MKSKVAKKYVEDGKHLVDLEVHAETQDGLIFMPATATVRLVSRTDPKSSKPPCGAYSERGVYGRSGTTLYPELDSGKVPSSGIILSVLFLVLSMLSIRIC